MKIRMKTTFVPALQQNRHTATQILNYKKNPRFQVLPVNANSCIIQKVDASWKRHPRALAQLGERHWWQSKAQLNNLCIRGELAQLGERVAGSDEVRGSSPLFSTTTALYTLFLEGFYFFLI